MSDSILSWESVRQRYWELCDNGKDNEAFKLMLPYAEKGYSYAQYLVGWSYYQGIGTSKNYDSAFGWLRKSAEAGDIEAQNLLGYCYRYGLGTVENPDKAHFWWSRSAAAGNQDAMQKLEEYKI